MEDNKYCGMDQFIDGLSSLDINLSDYQKQQFIDYYELLCEWNKVMNLTAITDFTEVIQKHYIDSLSIVKLYRPKESKIMDIGTGAGFPGIPLKIVFPEVNIVLLDSLKKRIHFLDEVINKLNLSNIVTLHGRAEDFGHNSLYRENFDLCVSRAVAKLSSLSEYCLPFIKKDGYFVSYKSGEIEEEVKLAENAFHLLGAEVETIERFKLPGSNIERSLIMIRKVDLTPEKYPRSAGKPTKEPL